MSRVTPPTLPPVLQTDATVNQANPISNTLYEWSSDGTQTNKLGTQKNVRINSATIYCEWNTTQPTPLTMILTIDGLTHTIDIVNPVNATTYLLHWNAGVSTSFGAFGTTDYSPYRAFLIEGRSVKIQVRLTKGDGAGTITNLSSRVKWAKYI